MKKNENVFIKLQIQKDQESKVLFLCIQFDKAASNFFIQDETITWCPTFDEIDFIVEAFELIGGYNDRGKTQNNVQPTERATETTNTIASARHSSEMRIAPPPPDDSVIEVTAEVGSSHLKKKTAEDNIFVQADEKTIDEVLKRKKPGVEEDYVIESGEKTLIDRMLKQKKKKE